MATILMTLAEKKAPRKYEWLINFLTLGRRIKIFKHIKLNYLRENQLLLDAGCGNGRFMEIADASWVTPIGVDISESMLYQTKRRFDGRRLHPKIIRCSITNLPLRVELFDIVICTLVLSELDQQQVKKSLSELYCCLKNHSLLILVTESKPKSRAKHYLFNLLRTPAFLIAALIAKIPRHPVHDMKALVTDLAGTLLEEKSYLGGHITLFILKKIDKT
ncbi:MAG: class I SAM-dependent methyltransferase [Candidatus Heimdallarchaeota archaeon]|nr:MAG: class I SAM-dependent methyltransferase [Candidatus Heimdallarchaeota archaeon]